MGTPAIFMLGLFNKRIASFLPTVKLKNMISMQEKILDIYDKIQDISSGELSVQTIFQMAGKSWDYLTKE